ncbi:hypothetical protein LDENG_00090490 [Lucifuga dentata]|nr:hypothetical protein LDENG_00090490 [Lucifuga dentata]
MLRGSLAAVSVFLCLLYPSILASQWSNQLKPCSANGLGQVRFLLSKVQDLEWLDCRLYTPTMEDYQQNCPSSTLSCFAAETNVLIAEWTTATLLKKRTLVSILGHLASRFNQTEGSECHQCEFHKEEEAKMFLNTLSSVLERMNFEHCKSSR